MTVYVDEAIWSWQGRKWCHLLADDIDELHRFARELGLHRISYQGPPKTASPHYDITALERRRAIAYGAMAVDRTTIVMVLHRLRRQVATSIRHPEVRDTDLGFTRDRHNRAQIGYNRLEGAPRRMTGTDSAAIHPSRLAANAARSSG